ncbi:hypothetical protein [Mesorhizobium retamae]|uniref:Uncharacterized protein n=1 Tax=Mesorhizobium retamae TaxID=2912854 RepID=A0ABS9QCL4_9HYPH|nr:hypothetical protein [Mesorhizobium sp. IRAMC:0171]MCG7505148.1 hypothetical protein [Mesorhizobium sp. IRAMC:0171]
MAARNAKPVLIVHKAGFSFKGSLCPTGGPDRNFVSKFAAFGVEKISLSQVRNGGAQSYSETDARDSNEASIPKPCLAPPVALAQIHAKSDFHVS